MLGFDFDLEVRECDQYLGPFRLHSQRTIMKMVYRAGNHTRTA